MNDKMSKNPVIINGDEITKLKRVPLDSNLFKEKWIQKLIEKEPSLLPTGDIEHIFEPLICIAREVQTKSGFIDNLYISEKGYLVIVETKLWRNPEARREVVGQILDYAKDVKEWTYTDIDNIYKEYNNGQSLFDKMVSEGYLTQDMEASFIDIVESNIRNARFLLMIVGDGIREGVEKIAEFLNLNPTMQYRFALCELEVYEYDGKRIVIPHLTLKTKIVERGIIRIEETNKNLIDIVMNDDKENDVEGIHTNKYSKNNYLTLDEWIKTKLKTNIDEMEFRGTLNDLENIGLVCNIGTNDMNLSYTFENIKDKVIFLRIFGDSESTVVLQPKTFYTYLEKHNYSRSIGDSLMESMRKFLRNNQKMYHMKKKKGIIGLILKLY